MRPVTVTDNVKGAPVEPVPLDLGAQIDALRIAVGRVEALAATAAESYDNTVWRDADPLQVERLAHLLGATAEAAAAAVAVVYRFETLIADQQAASAGDRW